MKSAEGQSAFVEDRSSAFVTTHWSVVLAAGAESSPDAQAALEQLCRTYWFPLYAYVRRQGQGEQDAQDATQAFFARFLEKGHVRLADPARGRFRSFLLTCLKRFLVNEWERGQAARRGAGYWFLSLDEQEAENRYQAGQDNGLSPDKAFDRRWATAVLERALSRLRAEYVAAGKEGMFEQLKTLVWGGTTAGTYPEIAAALGMSEGAARVAVHRVRQHYRDLLRAEVGQTVASPDEVDDELRYLIEILRQ
jgi:RNA polymerase sigma factor (sigma-70 family)